MPSEVLSTTLVSTGIPQFDLLLNGGFPARRLYLVEGDPGVGKTTFALQFLLEGVRIGEPALYITLSETREEIELVAASHGWSLEGLSIYDLNATGQTLESEWQQTLFHPSEVELNEATSALMAEVERVNPVRVVFDSLSELRLLAQNPLRYRRQLLALKQQFAGRRATVLLLDDRTGGPTDMQLMSLAHGVVSLEQLAPEYGPERRRLRIVKMRGVKFRGGYHDYTLVKGGLAVFPRLAAAEHGASFPPGQLSSGVAELDALLGGGIERGTSVLLLGPAGVGKTSLGLQFAAAALERGEGVAVFNFEEGERVMLARGDQLGMGLSRFTASGQLSLTQVNPAEISPGEFAAMIRDQVERRQVKILLIDTLNGYLNAMPEERILPIQLRELLTYLNHQGVVTFLVVGQQGMMGVSMQTTASVDVSYVADSVILLRYFEHGGMIHQAVSVVKKRSGAHERQIRQFRMTAAGIEVGDPLTQFQGVLSGTPIFSGNEASLMRGRNGQ